MNALRIASSDPYEPARGWRSSFTLTASAIGLILVVDQLLLPMFHVGDVPYKVSYVLLVLWALNRIAFRGDAFDVERRRDFAGFAWAVAGIAGCALLGEVTLSLRGDPSYAEPARSTMIYLLMVLAFGLGLAAPQFKVKWLIWVFFIAAGLNLAFILLKSALPSWLVNFYYSERVIEALSQFGVTSSEDVLLFFTRPRGIFPNPNGAMLMVNIIVLFIYLGFRHRVLQLPSTPVALAIVLTPVVVATLLASRSEFLVSFILAIANFRLMRRDMRFRQRRRFTASVGVLVLAGAVGLGLAELKGDVIEGANRIATLLEVVDRAQETDPEARNQGITRPLLTAERALDRFVYSPVFGTGYSRLARSPFDLGTQYYHNDWFRIAVTSGVIGLILMLWIIWKYCIPLGWITLLPFVITGLTNTFILNIPAVLFYFFMVGVFRQKLREREARARLAAA